MSGVLRSMASRWSLTKQGMNAEEEIAAMLATEKYGKEKEGYVHVYHRGEWDAQARAAWYNLYVDCGKSYDKTIAAAINCHYLWTGEVRTSCIYFLLLIDSVNCRYLREQPSPQERRFANGLCKWGKPTLKMFQWSWRKCLAETRGAATPMPRTGV